MIKIGVIGATGYAGQQLLWLLKNHKEVEIVFLTSYNYSHCQYHDVYPNFSNFIDKICIDLEAAEKMLACIDLLFIALPHGKGFDITEKAIKLGIKVIDLGANFRLNDENKFKSWYKIDHKYGHLLHNFVYGLPELYRNEIKNSEFIANPGCYPTASILALAPLVENNLINCSSIIIDAKSGVSGSGRKLNTGTLYCESNESVKAYSVSNHRHTPEIEQELSNLSNENITLSFTPHLIPMSRGILATCYASLKENIKEEKLYKIYQNFYKNEYFIRIIDKLPETRWIKGSNLCDISIKVDQRTQRVIVISAIDNLIKGAAGQAVQNMNIMFNLEETEGLQLIPMVP